MEVTLSLFLITRRKRCELLPHGPSGKGRPPLCALEEKTKREREAFSYPSLRESVGTNAVSC